MFTGIIEEIGVLQTVLTGARAGSVTIRAKTVLEKTRIGDSIAVNGVCLTVTGLPGGGFTADVMPETLRRTNLGALRPGDPVNLERAMAADGRFGGHIVAGHIDGTGTVCTMRREENAVWITIAAPYDICCGIVEKGSIAIDGVSLTVAEVTDETFSVSIIPHTAAQTVLLQKCPGSVVNLETDIVGKYVARLLHRADAPAPSGGITESFLLQHGF